MAVLKGISKGVRSTGIFEHSGKGVKRTMWPGLYKSDGAGNNKNFLIKNSYSFLTDTPSGSLMTLSFGCTVSTLVFVDYGDGTNLSPAINTSYNLQHTFVGSGYKKVTLTWYGPISVVNRFEVGGISGTGGPFGFFDLSKFKSLTTFQITNPSFSGGYKNIITGIRLPKRASLTQYIIFNSRIEVPLDFRVLESIGGNFQINGNAIPTIYWPKTTTAFTNWLANSSGLAGIVDNSALDISGAINVSSLAATQIIWGTSSGVFTQYYRGSSCTGLTSQDFSPLLNLGVEITMTSCSNLASATFPTNSNPFVVFNFATCKLTGTFNISSLSGISVQIVVNTNSLLTALTLPTSNRTVATLLASSCAITVINFLSMPQFTNVSGCVIQIQSNGMTAAQLNQILIDLDTNAVTAMPFLSHYDLENNSTDSSGNGNNGVDTAITYQLTPVKVGLYSANFNGTTSKINITHAASLNVGYNQISVAAWIYPTSFTGYQSVVSKLFSTFLNGWELSVNATSGSVRVTLYNNGNAIDTGASGGAATLNTWNHIAFVYDGFNLSLYLNGTLSVLRTGIAVIDTSADLIIGARNIGNVSISSFFTGNIDEVQIFNVPLSSTDITNIYNGGTGTTAPTYTSRTITANGTNAAPTGLGLVAKTSLQAKNFTVTTN